MLGALPVLAVTIRQRDVEQIDAGDVEMTPV